MIFLAENPASLMFLFVFLLQTFINQSYTSESLPNTEATISLPSDLSHYFKPGKRNETRIQFQFFGTEKLFPVRFLLHCISSSARNLFNEKNIKFEVISNANMASSRGMGKV